MKTIGVLSISAGMSVDSGSSTFTGAVPMIAGTVIMNTINSTSVTSTSGVTLIWFNGADSSS